MKAIAKHSSFLNSEHIGNECTTSMDPEHKHQNVSCWINYPRILSKTSKHIFLGAILLSLSNFISAEKTTIRQTQSKIKQFENKIDDIKQILTHHQRKRSILIEELANAEKQIGENIHQLRILEEEIAAKQLQINSLQRNMHSLNQKLIDQQQLLAEHLRTHYKVGAYQPLKWFLNQDDPYAINKILTLYEYLIRSRQQAINRAAHLKEALTHKQTKFQTELTQQQQLQQQLALHQKKLAEEKHYHQLVIQSLNKMIQNKQQTLDDYEHNKASLSRLLKTLIAEKQNQAEHLTATKLPFIQLRHRLPKPITSSKQNLQKINQGVIFFADEGSAVRAVYPGKVVFSDWLNGYGLLLILDHGQGFMTLYAHNQSLFKQKGQTAVQGEQIATVGHSGGLKESGLYFEVRYRGKAIPPLDWLS